MHPRMATSPKESPSVGHQSNRCLICDQVSPSTIIIKTEPDCLDDPKDGNTSSASAEATIGLESLETLCALLRLSPPLKARVLAKHHNRPSTVKFQFCSSCNGIIKDASDLFSQIENLDILVLELKSQVQAMISAAYDRHVKQYQNSDQSSLISTDKEAYHKCKDSCGCDQVDKIRRLFVAGAHGQKKENTHSLDPAKYANEKSNASVHPFKEVSIILDRLTDKEIKTKGRTETEGDLNGDNFNGDSRNGPDLGIDTLTEVVDADAEYEDIDFQLDDLHDNSSEAEAILGLEHQPQRWELPLSVQKQEPVLKVHIKKKIGRPRKQPCELPVPVQKDPLLNVEVERVKKPRGRPRKHEGPKIGIIRKGPVPCPECDQIFRNSYMQQRHMVKCHGVEPSAFPFDCSRCGKRYGLEIQLQRHLFSQGGVCNKNPVHMNCEIVSENGITKFVCKICNHAATSRNRFENHYVSHSKVKKHVCELCGLSFLHLAGARQHKLQMHFDGSLEEHPLHCSFKGCGKVFGRKSMLMAHEKLHRGEFDFMCSKCDFRTVTIGRLTKHYQSHEDGRYKCEQCLKVYKRSDKLNNHIRQHHTKPEDRPHRCQVCGKTFCSKQRLDRHEIIHTNEKPCACEICGKRFAVRDYLAIHMKTHRRKGQEVPTST